MGVAISMSSYEIGHDETLETEYDAEILCSGWNPVVALACQQHDLLQADRHVAMPSSLATVDVEVFLEKMYACQR